MQRIEWITRIEDGLPKDCGCCLYGGDMYQCDMHRAAPALLDALEALTLCAELGIPPYASLIAARAAIAQARGEA